MNNHLLKGNIIAVGGYLIWGFLPLYWGVLGRVASMEIVAHRIILSAVVVGIYLLVQKRKDVFEKLKDKKTRRQVVLAGLAIGVNWTVFILAILSGRVLESSLAYYINPLVVILFGMLFLGEPVGKFKIAALVLAAIGVLVLIFGYSQFPTYALIMAVSFSIYGIIKKKIGLDAYVGLFAEMIVLLPIAIGLQVYSLVTRTSVYFGGIDSWWFLVLLLLSGAMTMLPLVLYNTSIQMITLGNIGFLQFIAPTIMFLISVFINGEVFTTVHLVAFSFIWVAVIVYCVYLVLNAKKKREQKV